MKRFFKIFVTVILGVLLVGYLIPERKAMPCGTSADYNHQSFWYWPWTRGTEGCPHTGIDIFGRVGTPVVAQTGGLVLYAGNMPGKAGNSVFVLGPKWKIHEYLHLHTVDTKFLRFVKPDEKIGTLGKTGNAATTPAHLHYGVVSPIPYVWRLFSEEGSCDPPKRFNWRLMFWLNPTDQFPVKIQHRRATASDPRATGCCSSRPEVGSPFEISEKIIIFDKYIWPWPLVGLYYVRCNSWRHCRISV